MERNVSEYPYSPASQPPENLLTSSRRSTLTENYPRTPLNKNLLSSYQGIESAFSRLTLSQDFRPHGRTPPFLGYPATNSGVASAGSVPLPVALGENQQAFYWAQSPSYDGRWNGRSGFTRAPPNINVGPRGMGFLGRGSNPGAGNHSLNMIRDNYGYSSLHDTETFSRNSINHFPALISAQQYNSYSSPRPSVYSNESFQQRQHTLKNGRGRTVSLARDSAGIGILNSKLEQGLSEEEIEMVLEEVMNSLSDLLRHQFGSFFVPRLFWACNEHQRTRMIAALTRYPHMLVDSCLISYGAGAMQKILRKVVTPQQISLVTSALSIGAIALSIHADGWHVIEYCVKKFPVEYNKHIFNEIADNCFRIATNKNGSHVLKSCLETSDQEARERLISNIIENAVHLAEDPYGHVVENFFLLSGESCSAKIITELVESPDAEWPLLDHWGNFVIKTALKVSKGRIRDKLLLLIQNNAANMENNIYGKRILDLLEKMRLRSA